MADVAIRQPVPLRTVPGIELAAIGTWKASTGETTFTPEDMAGAVAALECPGVRNPVIKLGHTEEDSTSGIRWDGEPAVGWVANMRLDDDGKLRGDFTGMPAWLADADENGLSVLAAAYPDRSIEIWRPFVCQVGHTHPSVITAVALLGVAPPGVGVLKSMQDVYAAWTVDPETKTAPVGASAVHPEVERSGLTVSTTVRLAAPEPREPTDIERQARTDFDAVREQWQAALDDAVAQWPAVAEAQRAELAAQIETAVEEPEGLGELAVSAAAAALVIGAAMSTLADLSAVQMIAEAVAQGIADPGDIDVPGLDDVADGVAAAMAASTASAAGRTAAQLLGSGTGGEIADATLSTLEGFTDRFLYDQIGGALSAAQCAGRIAALRELPPARYFASELQDADACAPCRAIDGREFDSLDEAATAYGSGKYTGCLGGPRCRGLLVAVWPVDRASGPMRTTVRTSVALPPLRTTVRLSIGDT